jgi:DNA-binding NtrC family response regulator
MTNLAELLVGESIPMRKLRALVLAAAPTSLSVLVHGPTGSGKELVAAALHAASGRRGRLVAFNVCAIGDAMFEDALFGHARGAFTGALGDTQGFLREADGGTAFLDEISGLPLALQAKLLRAIETGEFRPVGAKHDVRSDFRVVAATNERLDELVAQHRFRADLSHRIGAIVVHVPPLCERTEDLPLLATTFLRRMGLAHLPISTGALDRLRTHVWPGNVRELKQIVEWAATLATRCIDDEIVATALAHRASGPELDDRVLERKLLRDALESVQWDTRLAARELGIHRATLYRRMKRLQITVPALRSVRPVALAPPSRAQSHAVARPTGESRDPWRGA